MTAFTLRSTLAALFLTLGPSTARAEDDDSAPQKLACAQLASLSFEGNTRITKAEEVLSGTLVTPGKQTLSNLPAFCRVVGISAPSSDSNIYFEVWLPSV